MLGPSLYRGRAGPIIDILRASIAAQSGPLPSLLKCLILPPGILPVHNQRQLLLETEIARYFILLDRFESVDHALQSHVDQLFYSWLM
jgi:hypothetical protein